MSLPFQYVIRAAILARINDPDRSASAVEDRDRQLEDFLATIQQTLDDHEARITALEP